LAQGHEVPAIFYGSGERDCWPGGPVSFVSRPVRRPLGALASSVAREIIDLEQSVRGLGSADAVIVRDDSIMALMLSRHRGQLGPLILQISHLFPEEVRAHADARLYGSPSANRLKAAAAARLRSMAIKAAARVLVMTPEARDWLGLQPDRCAIVPEGVDADWKADLSASEMRAFLRVPPSRPLITYAGTFNRVRDLDTFLAGFAILRRTLPDAVLVIAGRGREAADEDHLRAVVNDRGVADAVLFPGPLPHARVAALLDASDLAVSPLPSTTVLRCNSPTKVFEALQRGRAVVASDIPEQRRVIEASGGGVIVRHEAHAYARAMGDLLPEADRRREMGRRGREWVLAHRSYELLARTVDDSIRDVRGSAAPRAPDGSR